jgi:hypothetical protein
MLFEGVRVLGRSLVAQVGLALVCCVLPGTQQASAQGRLEAHYEASLAGLTVGKGTWTIEIGDDQYTAAASGGSSGLLKAFSGGQGTSASQGRVINGQLVPSSYLATMQYEAKKSETIRIALAGGNVKESAIEPEPPFTSERIPVTEAHRKGVIDPMTGSLVRVGGGADLISADSCKSVSSIFDGRMRYDLRLDYKRIETVKSKTYQGPVLVCAIYFAPLAGYIPDRAAIKYLTAQRNMEVWLAPIAGTRVLAPYKVLVPTPLGMAALEATQFVTTASARTTAKTQ